MRRTGKREMVVGLLLMLALSLYAEDITFSGGYTRVSMQEGDQSITLGNGATVTVGSLTITAGSITLSGEEYDSVDCIGNVEVRDPERGIALSTASLFYDRTKDRLVSDSWVEVEDETNEVAASAGWLSFDLQNGTISLQISVHLLRHTEDGAMECKADTLLFDREEKTLQLTGNATVDWPPDSYAAQMISVDLDTKEIAMDGSIEGTVHG